MIDLHFFHCLGQRRCAGNQHGITALSGEQFDFDAAARFAMLSGATNTKLSALGLSDAAGIGFCRYGARVLRKKSDARSRAQLDKSLPGVEAQLRANRRTNNADIKTWAELIQAGEALNSLGIEVNQRNLDDMHALMFGFHKTRPDVLHRKYKTALDRLAG